MHPIFIQMGPKHVVHAVVPVQVARQTYLDC
jgi:hypothetical protein